MKLLMHAALVVFSPLDVFGQTSGAQGTPKVTVVDNEPARLNEYSVWKGEERS